jgi:hypothetical protein
LPLALAWLSETDYAFVGTAQSECYLRDEQGWFSELRSDHRWPLGSLLLSLGTLVNGSSSLSAMVRCYANLLVQISIAPDKSAEAAGTWLQGWGVKADLVCGDREITSIWYDIML